MKIAVVVGRFPVVSEQFIVNHIAGLIESGHDVTIVSGFRGNYEMQDGNTDRFRMRDRTLYVGIPSNPIARSIVYGVYFFLTLLSHPRVALSGLRYRRYRTAVINGKAIYFYRRLRGMRFDLIHCHFGANGLVGAFLKDAGITEKLIVTFHGSDINTYPRRYGVDVYKEMYHVVDAITCNTRFTADKVVANGARPETIHIVPVGLDTRNFPVRSDTRDSSRFVLLTVGRMVEKKGHRYVMLAISSLLESIPNIEYRILGDGPLRTELEDLSRELGLSNHCTFLGARVGEEVVREYQTCDLFVLASVTASSGDMEGQGRVLQEAQSMGVPVISTVHNGIPDGVVDGVTGLLVPERDAHALADAIQSLHDDRTRMSEMGREGARFVREKYDIRIIRRTIDDLYGHVLTQS